MAKMLLLPWLTWQGVVLRSFAMHFQSGHLSNFLGIHGSRENKTTCHVFYREGPFDGVINACHSFKNEIVTCIFSFFLVLKALLYMSILGYSLSDMHSSLSIPFKRFYCDAREKSSAGGCRGTPRSRTFPPARLRRSVCASAHALQRDWKQSNQLNWFWLRKLSKYQFVEV